MQKLLLLFLILLSPLTALFPKTNGAASFAPEGKESIHYDVYFQWGFIWKKAGAANLTLAPTTFQGKQALNLNLIARTTPAFDRVTRVRDTLVAYTTPTLTPLYYAKIVHEGDYRATDKVHYTYPLENPNQVEARIQQYRKNTLKRDTTIAIATPAFDMLSVFYHLRTLDMSQVKVDTPFPATIISGRHAVKISITYKKEESYKAPSGKSYECYYFRIQFYDEKGKVDKSDLFEYWMSRDNRRLPVQVAGKLKIGYLRAIISD